LRRSSTLHYQHLTPCYEGCRVCACFITVPATDHRTLAANMGSHLQSTADGFYTLTRNTKGLK